MGVQIKRLTDVLEDCERLKHEVSSLIADRRQKVIKIVVQGEKIAQLKDEVARLKAKNEALTGQINELRKMARYDTAPGAAAIGAKWNVPEPVADCIHYIRVGCHKFFLLRDVFNRLGISGCSLGGYTRAIPESMKVRLVPAVRPVGGAYMYIAASLEGILKMKCCQGGKGADIASVINERAHIEFFPAQ